MNLKLNSSEWFEAIAAELKQNLDEVADEVAFEDAGGGLVVLHVTVDGVLDVWGTANETWGADRYLTQRRYEEGDPDTGLEIDLRSDEPNPATVAAAIAAFYQEKPERESESSKHCDAGYLNDVRFGTDGDR